ncbi:Uncharacterised protein [Vibrio cholerae]|uniref:Uncharacterized protein n=1 Tax=Vibrio cholerae TaxID=666 RepID=A0A655R5J8_VIBCL|nr:Uncharacterised protein [Vibrio cholerae]CSB04889.1 Uncharacterised protein [Vibrio cholerae]CSB10781.1 Uncharacterised protein [Vibrio cholerae]CSB51956.1 Uncharacterised protein [Vibrio cholerae]CSC82123.1 Uncharacterised protein [Vibrio cholerae]
MVIKKRHFALIVRGESGVKRAIAKTGKGTFLNGVQGITNHIIPRFILQTGFS